jgi:hypothetical protein
MKKIIFSIHSVVDLITNSSTEIYVIDTEQELEMIRAIIKELEEKFPTEYGYHVYADYMEEWELKEMFDYIDEEKAVEYLTALGYKVEKPTDDSKKAKYISISCERGCMHPELQKFIESTFKVIDHDD